MLNLIKIILLLRGDIINNIKEYIFIFDSDIFKVYSHNVKEAEDTFADMCKEYSKSNNETHAEYWKLLFSKIASQQYQCILNEDFKGVRRVL